MPDRPAPSMRRVHALLGVLCLAPWAVLDLVHLVAATEGRDAFVLRFAQPSLALPILFTLTFVAPLVVHSVLGVSLARRTTSPFPDEGARALQLGSAVVVLAFLVAHVRHTPLALFGDVDAYGLYARLRTELQQPAWVAIYVIGLTAFVLHLAQGLVAAVRSFRLPPAATRLLRVLAVVAAGAFYVGAVHALAHFVVGRAIFRSDASAQGAAS